MGGYPTGNAAPSPETEWEPGEQLDDGRGVFPPVPGAGLAECAALSCSICFNIYEQPASLPLCGHTFCMRCVRGLTACPVCRRPIVEELPPVPNYPLRALLEEMNLSPDVELEVTDGWDELRAKARIHQRCMACEEYHADGIFGFCSVCLDAVRRMSSRRLLSADDIFRTLSAEAVLEQTREANHKAKLMNSLEYQRSHLDRIIPTVPQPAFMPGPMFRSLVGAVKQGLTPKAVAAKLSELEHPILSAHQSKLLLEAIRSSQSDDTARAWHQYEHVVCSRVLDNWNLEPNSTGGCYYGITRVEVARSYVSPTEREMKVKILQYWQRSSRQFWEAQMDRKTQDFMKAKLQG